MAKHGKKYMAALAKVDLDKEYSTREAVALAGPVRRHDAHALAALRAPGVERRIDVAETREGRRERREHAGVVAVVDRAHAGQRSELGSPLGIGT